MTSIATRPPGWKGGPPGIPPAWAGRDRWAAFLRDRGLAVVPVPGDRLAVETGAASGNLVALCFHTPAVFRKWAARVAADARLAGWSLGRQPVVRTPSGITYVWARVAGPTPASAVLARDKTGRPLAEVIGPGRLVPAPCGGRWSPVLLSPGWLTAPAGGVPRGGR